MHCVTLSKSIDHNLYRMETVSLAPTNIYILKLEDDCWYVGRTADVKKRVEHHFKRYGSAWTKLHRPIHLEIAYGNASPFDEDKYTKEYMLKYGIDKVRGGTYSQPTMNNAQKRAVQQELWGAQDLCFLCGGNHFVKNCSAATDVFRNPISQYETLDTQKLINNKVDSNYVMNKKSRECFWNACVCIYNAIRGFLTPPAS